MKKNNKITIKKKSKILRKTKKKVIKKVKKPTLRKKVLKKKIIKQNLKKIIKKAKKTNKKKTITKKKSDQIIKTKIVCSNIWKIFGPNEKSVLSNLNKKLSRNEVQEKTGHVIAVKDVSFSVQKGETFVVMGLSGSGKSTLVRCLSRLIEPTAGEVRIDDIDVTQMSVKELTDLRRNRMSMVFQHFGLFPHRKVIENIGYGLEIRGVKKKERIEKSMETLKLVGLEGWDNHYPRELSGGMQQRVGLARALAVDPEILIFDEPFSALDPLIRREMQDELLSIQRMVQKTMVFITHDFSEAIKMGDHIAIMKDGEISQVGTPEEIVASPVDQYVKDFTEDVPKYKVLSAGKVCRRKVCKETKVTFNKGKNCIQSNSKIDGLMDMCCDTDSTFPVVDSKSGKLIGEIDRTIIMRSMTSG
tara:strand:- start:29 stop:1276 length:1248 start_codon:yes stop_codon:yes gene_type:complete